MRDNIRRMPAHDDRSEFWQDLVVWFCAVFYGIVVAAIVVFVLGLLWLRWGW